MPEVTGPLSTTADSDVYPTHDSTLGLGGLRECADHLERNAIPPERRRVGMLAYTSSDANYWSLLPEPWDGSDNDWQSFFIGGGGAYRQPTSYPVTAVSTWSQMHTYPYPPEVRLIDDQDRAADIGVEYPDSLSVYIEFPTPFTGTIILS